MTELNLVANTPEQEKVKSYLEENVSEMLALKINTGTKLNIIPQKTLE